MKNKNKYNSGQDLNDEVGSAYNSTSGVAAGGPFEGEDGNPGFNIMYDKRVFRGNTHNFNLMK